jgi:hypothetical protein
MTDGQKDAWSGVLLAVLMGALSQSWLLEAKSKNR